MSIEASYGIWSWIILAAILGLSVTWLIHVWRMPSLNDEIEKANNNYHRLQKQNLEQVKKLLNSEGDEYDRSE